MISSSCLFGSGYAGLGVAKLDQLVRKILSKSLRPAPKKEYEILENELRDFASRIKICYLLGLFDKRYFNILNRMRKIRNYFAHQVDCSLNTDRIKSIVNDLSGAVIFQIAKDALTENNQAYTEDKSGRYDFKLILFFLVFMLELRLRIGVKPIYKETKGLWMKKDLQAKS